MPPVPSKNYAQPSRFPLERTIMAGLITAFLALMGWIGTSLDAMRQTMPQIQSDLHHVQQDVERLKNKVWGSSMIEGSVIFSRLLGGP